MVGALAVICTGHSLVIYALYGVEMGGTTGEWFVVSST
jgi:hypothetical protein